jgi:phospholipase C
MSDHDTFASNRRNFRRALGAGAVATALPDSIRKALAMPANNATGSIQDIEHIVILMQENRAFDHYFGTLQGVRGYGDPRAVTLPSGKSVFYQPAPNADGYVLPFHPTAPDLGLQFVEDLPHDWDTTHATLNNGAYNQWVPQKSQVTMAHMERHDIPYHFALADAFTVCDAYHCSLLGPTDPNRYHMWTGWVGNNGAGGGPVVDNAEAGYGWSTFPERLEQFGISWKIYQDVGTGLTEAGEWGYTSDAYIGNYGDNSLLYFHQYQNAPDSSPLAIKARTGTNISVGGTLFDIFRADVANNTLPQVSWIVAPEAYCEHPNWPVNYGAWYISQFIDALTSNPELWSKTALFLTYDENDGFFDHAVPPTPPQTRDDGLSTIPITNEIFPGSSEYPAGPYGLGVRVPMIVISPWTKGGWVDSQVFDHTSLIRFIEARFGKLENEFLFEKNITPWRRAVCGDLTSAFNFVNPNDAIVKLPSTASYVPPDNDRHPDYVPTPPAVQRLPRQELGVRRARALPYRLEATARVDFAAQSVELSFVNTGSQAAVFHVRSGVPALSPRNYTVGARHRLTDTIAVVATGATVYDLSITGPNGFLRALRGSVLAMTSANLAVHTRSDPDRYDLAIDITNLGSAPARVTVTDLYTGLHSVLTIQPGETATKSWSLEVTFGWYDVLLTEATDTEFRRQLAGHQEIGLPSITDPAIGIAV